MKLSGFQPTFILPQEVLIKILKFTGELSNVVKVCKLFKLLAEKEGNLILEDLLEKYGSKIVKTVLDSLSMGKSSHLVKIDALFMMVRLKATLNALPKEKQKALLTNPYDVMPLKEVIDPYVYSASLLSFWEALYKQAPASLQKKMKAMVFNSNPLIRMKQMRAFLEYIKKDLLPIKSLHLNNLGLDIVPEEIRLFENLTLLDLSENNLTVLPDLSALKKLNILKLNNNQLTVLQKTICDLPELKFLFLSDNKLFFIHDSLGNLSKLRTLLLNGNKLVVIPKSIGKLASLNKLSLENNQLKTLPGSIGGLGQLKLLYLYNNKLTSLPSSISELKSLNVLSAASNQLTDLPPKIVELENLEILMLDNNAITALPKNLKEMKSLQELYISDNPLSTIPDIPSLKHLGCESIQRNHEMTFKGQRTKDEFLLTYEGLGSDKWKESVEGCFHYLGKWVFDKGLHKGAVEPGFLKSIENLFDFLRNNFGRRVDANFYLEMHKVACAHFDGKKTQTLIEQSKVGQFRDQGCFGDFGEPAYVLTAQAQQEFQALNYRLERMLGVTFSLGEFVKLSDSPVTYRIKYQPLSSEQVKIIFNYFITEFYSAVAAAADEEGYLRAIATLFQHSEWLHPPQDGCGRTDVGLLNFLLASYKGLNPALLPYLFVSTCSGIDEWVAFLKLGMEYWRKGSQNTP